MPIPRIMQQTDSLVVCYPQAHHFQDLQQSGFWTANEVNLEKDIQPLLTDASATDRAAILETLRLFTHYERRADEFWGDVVKNLFPRPEIQEMAALFSAMELSVHRRVYDKLAQLLFVSNDEFYNSYKEDETLSSRMKYLDDMLVNGTALEKIGGFAFAEGVVLFSSFAFLMSYRANGKNLLPNIGLAIKFSARDEDIHCQASTWLFKQLKTELEELEEDTSYIEDKIIAVAHKIREHEYAIIDIIFSHGKIDGITSTQMKHFVDSRINVVMKRLGFKKLFDVTYNPIAVWWDKIVESFQYVDFFAGQGSSYSRGWNRQGFKFKVEGE